MVVRSDDVAGNEVTGMAWRSGTDVRRCTFVARFPDDGEVIDCSLDAARGQ